MIIEVYPHVTDATPYVTTSFAEADDILLGVYACLSPGGFQKTEFRVWFEDEGYYADARPDFTGCPTPHKHAELQREELSIAVRIRRFVRYYEDHPAYCKRDGITSEGLADLWQNAFDRT